jgi:hypothetical protein
VLPAQSKTGAAWPRQIASKYNHHKGCSGFHLRGGWTVRGKPDGSWQSLLSQHSIRRGLVVSLLPDSPMLTQNIACTRTPRPKHFCHLLLLLITLILKPHPVKTISHSAPGDSSNQAALKSVVPLPSRAGGRKQGGRAKPIRKPSSLQTKPIRKCKPGIVVDQMAGTARRLARRSRIADGLLWSRLPVQRILKPGCGGGRFSCQMARWTAG